MWRNHGYLRKSAYEEGEEGEPTVLLDSAAARLVKHTWQTLIISMQKIFSLFFLLETLEIAASLACHDVQQIWPIFTNPHSMNILFNFSSHDFTMRGY